MFPRDGRPVQATSFTMEAHDDNNSKPIRASYLEVATSVLSILGASSKLSARRSATGYLGRYKNPLRFPTLLSFFTLLTSFQPIDNGTSSTSTSVQQAHMDP